MGLFFFSCSLRNHEQPKWDLIPLKLVWLPTISGLQGFLAQAWSERNKTGLGLESALKWYSHICMALPLTQLALVLIQESDKPQRMTNIWLQYLFLANPKGGLAPRTHFVTFPPTSFQQWDFGCGFGELGLWVFLSFLCKGWPHSVCLHSYLGLLIKSYSQLSWLLVDYFSPFHELAPSIKSCSAHNCSQDLKKEPTQLKTIINTNVWKQICYDPDSWSSHVSFSLSYFWQIS